MNIFRIIRNLSLIALAFSSLYAQYSHAVNVCTPINAPPPRFVGVTGNGSLCTDDTIQSAINAVQNANYVCPAKIYVTREHTYTSQHLTIDNVPEGLSIIGEGDGVHCGSTDVQICDPDTGCPPPPTQSLVTIDGSYTGGSVFSITGDSNVTLEYLHITHGGNAQTGVGGGIHFNGTGSLTIDTSEVTFNEAQYGGGINFNANGGSAALTLAANTQVLENIADASYPQGGGGGGILLAGQAHLVAVQPRTLIAFNSASSGNGGGIDVLSPAVADIGSPGYNGVPVIYNNSAEYGGGIAVDGYDGSESGDNYSALVRLFTTDPAHPVQVSDNTASHTGGGIWLKPYVAYDLSGHLAQFCAYNFRIDDNIAQEGTAIYSDSDYTTVSFNTSWGGDVYLNYARHPNAYVYCEEDENNPDPISNYGAVACASGVACNTMDGNFAEDNTNTATPGSVILIQDNGYLYSDRFSMRNNSGAHALRLIGSYADIENCLLADNTVGGELVRIENDGEDTTGASIDGCTFANNGIGGDSVINSDSYLTLTDSIVAQPGVPTLAYSGDPSNLTVKFVLSNDTSTLPTTNGGLTTGIEEGAPTFVNAAGGDYHLQLTSIGIDYAPASGGKDLDNLPRDVDLSPPNPYGPRDIGAYERQYDCGMDTIFCSGFDPFP